MYLPDIVTRGVPVVERAFLFRLAPEHFVVAVGIERRVDGDQIHAAVGQFLQLLQVVAGVDDARVHE
jgi:hypothetical protein